jgi:hypothetical protein
VSIRHRLKRLERATVDLSHLSDAELEAIVGHDAEGEYIRSLSDAELEKLWRQLNTA